MANAYATLADGGAAHERHDAGRRRPAGADLDHAGSPTTRATSCVRNSLVRARVLQPWQAGLETSILQQVIERGTGVAAAIGRPAAGKTGTTTNYADAWFCGYTPDLSAAVWVGYPRSQQEMIVRGIRVAGGTFPAADLEPLRERRPGRRAGPRVPLVHEPPVVKRIVCARTGDLATRWCPERLKCFYFTGQAPDPALHVPRAATGECARPDRPAT